MNHHVTIRTWRPVGDWAADAKCVTEGVDPELFYPLKWTENGRDSADVIAAKAFCIDCPVADACLDDAIDADDNEGMWGGMTPDERRPLKPFAPDERRLLRQYRARPA